MRKKTSLSKKILSSNSGTKTLRLMKALETIEIDWKMVYKNIYNSTIDIKLRNFQYKFVNRIIPTNKSLMKFNIRNSNICDFCNMQVESIKHLFWECNHVQHLWNNIENWLRNINLGVDITFKNISLGILDKRNQLSSQAINYIIILAK